MDRKGPSNSNRRTTSVQGHQKPTDNVGRPKASQASISKSGTSSTSSSVKPPDPKSPKYLARAHADNRVSKTRTAKKKYETSLEQRNIRFSQSSISSRFSPPRSPEQGGSIKNTLRNLNPLSVLTEDPSSGEGAPKLLATPNADEPTTVTTFDHRRVVNSALHDPKRKLAAEVVDSSSVPRKQWKKYTTETRGESIDVLSPDSTRKQPISLGSLSPTQGPDPKLRKNTSKALKHMVNRSAMLEAIASASDPSAKAGKSRALALKEGYQKRLDTFKKVPSN